MHPRLKPTPVVKRKTWRSSWIGFAALMTFCPGALAAEVPANDLEQAFHHLSTYTWSESRAPLNAIDAAIRATSRDAVARKSLERRLAGVLRTGAPFPAKQYVCRKLSQIGTADSIPALAPLLVDPALSHPARFALERIPDPGAVEALRRALAQTEGNVKVGIVHSLGALDDTTATGLLMDLLAGADADVAVAAASVLGRFATLDAAKHQKTEIVSALKQALRASPHAAVREKARRVLERLEAREPR